MTLKMVEGSSMLGLLAGALLFAAVAAWFKLRRGRLLPGSNGDATARTADLESASRLLLIALAVSLVAAVLALAGLMFG